MSFQYSVCGQGKVITVSLMMMKRSRHGRPKALAEINFASSITLLKNKSHKEIFTLINEKNLWGAVESSSGLGSELSATEFLRNELTKLLLDLKISTLLDLPCGDFRWMAHAQLPVDQYIGGDIVDSIIKKLDNEFSGLREEVDYSFFSLNILSDSLPKSDLVLCRDCLVHFSFDSISKAIQNIKNSQSTFLLATSFPEQSENIDIHDGDWRPLNFEKPPFSFGPPERIINERCSEVNGAYADKSLALWKIKHLPSIVI